MRYHRARDMDSRDGNQYGPRSCRIGNRSRGGEMTDQHASIQAAARFLWREPRWRMVKNLKRFEKAGFRSHNFLAQMLSETSRACTIRVRRSTLGRLWNDLGSHAGLHHRNRRPGTSTEERIPGRREPDPESPNQRPAVVIRWRKSYVGGDRPPAGTESLGRIGGCRETGYAAGLVVVRKYSVRPLNSVPQFASQSRQWRSL